MAIFQKTKTPSVNDLTARRDAIRAKLDEAEFSLNELRGAAVAAASDDLAAVSDKAAEAWKIEFSVSALRTAIQTVDGEIAVAVEAEAARADKLTREATSRQINTMGGAIEKAIAPLPDILRALTEAVEAARPLVGEVGLTSFVKTLSRELPDAAATLVAACRARARETLSGTAPASLPKPFVPAIVPSEPVAPVAEIFTLARLQWKTGGNPHTVGAYQIAALPAGVAKVALERRLASTIRATWRCESRDKRTNWPHILDAEKVHDLDADPRAPKNYNSRTGRLEDITPEFTPVDRGPPFSVAVDRPGFSPEPLSQVKE